MLFIEDLLTTVLQTTGRPDQKAWALVSLNNCLKELSRTADYPQDLYETEFLADDPGGAELSGPINLPIPEPSTFIISPSYEAVIRKIAYLTYDNQKLTEVTPHNLMLAGCPELDIFYRNGQNLLVINPSRSYISFKIGVYCLPSQLMPDTRISHWLLDSASEVLITGAIAKVYKNTGDDASHDRYFQEYNMMKRQFKLDNANSGVI